MILLSSEKRLDKAYKNAMTLPFDGHSKIIIMSDCHRGQGNAGDNFLANQTVCFGALEYYLDNGFTYIELGDGDELWENRKLKTIVEVHSDIFWIMSEFYRRQRLYLVYGNHDIVKRSPDYMRKHCADYYCEQSRCQMPLLPDISVGEGLILQNEELGKELFLVHGHQGDFFNDVLWPLSRFLVRYVWRPLELIGFLDPTGAGRPRKAKEGIERKLMSYAEKRKEILVAGHTHRPVFSRHGEGYYFNDGSCVHPRCITGIEIVQNQITLVKWSVRADESRRLCVKREILEGPAEISEYM